MQNKSRLKIWVCEFVSAGGLASESLPASLLQEGLLMRDALLADLSVLDVDCITSHDARVNPPEHATSVAVQPGDDVLATWRRQLVSNAVDACWVIAPETDGTLQCMCEWVQGMGKRWIGCSAEAISITTSKSAMTDICQQAGIAVVPYAYLKHALPISSLPWYPHAHAGWVIKPDDGAGCEFTYYFNNEIEVIEFNNKINSNYLAPYDKLLLQPYISGQALSMSVLSTQDQVKVIAAHQQDINIKDGRFHFAGAQVNKAAQYLPLMQTLAERIHATVPGLVGYWGADMILTDDDALTLVEINPRLTTPYIALSQLFTESPAQYILDAVLNNRLTAIEAQSSAALTLSSDHVQPAADGKFATDVEFDANIGFSKGAAL